MPRWLSSAKVEVVRKLLAEDPAMLLRESLGISADGSEKAFAQRDVEDMLARQAPELEYSARDPRRNTQHVFLAVDPSGGGASAFSICSILQDANGFMHVRLRMHTNSTPLHLHSPILLLFKIHAHGLPGPQLTQCAHERHERIGVLPHASHKRGNAHRKHTRLEILHELGVAPRKRIAHARLLVQRKQQRRPLGRDALDCGLQCDDPRLLQSRLVQRIALAHLLGQDEHGPAQTGVQIGTQRLGLKPFTGRQWLAKEQRPQLVLDRREHRSCAFVGVRRCWASRPCTRATFGTPIASSSSTF